MYDLWDTHNSVSGLPLVRGFLFIAKNNEWHKVQMIVETAFLYGELHEDIFMEIPEVVNVSGEYKENCVWKMTKSLYSVKTSPKK